jgi:heterodisulfide reductase subunit B
MSGEQKAVRLAYYPGCVSRSTGKEMDLSTRAVCSALGLELEELADWNCCGATHVANELVTLGLSARNLAQTELPIMTSCAICYCNLRTAAQRLADPALLSRINGALAGKPSNSGAGQPEIGHPEAGHSEPEHSEAGRSDIGHLEEGQPELRRLGAKQPEVWHALEVILGALEKDRDSVVVPLNDLKVAPYYGCLMTRPKGIDSAEFPTVLERLLKILKAEPLEFRLKTFCCGGPIFMPHEEAAAETAYKILKEAGKAGAEVIVTLCPLCHLMLDAKQRILEGKRREKIGIPVLYVTQLVGIALGLGPEELGLNMNSVSPMAMVERIYEKMAEGK